MERQKEMTELETHLGLLLEAESMDSAMDAYLAASKQLGVLFGAQIDYIVENRLGSSKEEGAVE